MDLFFLRHGLAADRGTYASDFERPLTEEGTRKMQLEGKALKKLGVRPEAILMSPLVRARETAEIVAKSLGLDRNLYAAAELACGCDLTGLARALEPYAELQSVMVVGHEPDFSLMISELIDEEVEMKKGAVAFVKVSGQLKRKNGTLMWLKPPKELVAIAERR